MPRILGDLIHDGLARIGVTPQRVSEWLGVCGCKERQEKLNALDRWARRSIGLSPEESKQHLETLTDE